MNQRSNVKEKNPSHSRAFRKWGSYVSSRVGLLGLPLQIHILLILGFLFSIGRNIAFPYFAMFLKASSESGGLDFDASLIGFIVMIGGLSYTFILPATGSLCDRIGRRRMMMASMIPQVVLTAGYAYAHTYIEFILLYAATGVLGAFYDPASSAMVADLVEPSRREEVYGLIYMISNIGTVVGPPIGGIIASVSGYPILFVYAAVFAGAGATILVLFIKESHIREVSKMRLSQFAGIFKDRLFILFCFMGAMTNLVYTQLYGLLSVYTEYVGFQPYIFGIFFSLNGAMVVTLQIPIRKAAMMLGAAKAFIVAQLLYAIGFTYFMFAADFFQFVAGIVVLTLGEIIFVPASSGFVANMAPADMRGRYMAMLGLFFGIGGSAGSQIAFSIFGILADKRVIWGILGIVGFATLLGYGLLLKMVSESKASTVH
jgi:MFS family permease